MVEWLLLNENDKLSVIKETAARALIAANAVEKDWWVTLTLKACFLTPWQNNLVFKGGTSLSKAWQLIERFSEDIDLVMNREALGFTGELTNNQIRKLRQKTAIFMATDFRASLLSVMASMGVDTDQIKLNVQEGGAADRDPQILELHYPSVLQNDGYIPDKVLIEIGARSLMEPAEIRTIQSIIGKHIPDQPFSGTPYEVLTVDPRRTFLEKIFLLHEEFTKPVDKIRTDRMSRHLYDLERLMDSQFGISALADDKLYELIVHHRAKYTAIRGLNYANHYPSKVDFIPPIEVITKFQEDYQLMRESMIHGPSETFDVLMQRMEELKVRIRSKSNKID